MSLERRIRTLEQQSAPDPVDPLAIFEDTRAGRLYLLPSGRLEPEAPAPARPVKLWRGIDPKRV